MVFDVMLHPRKSGTCRGSKHSKLLSSKQRGSEQAVHFE